MTGNNKVKTAKQLQGKKGTGKKDLHPESRRVKQAARVDLRTKKIAVGKKERDRHEQEKLDRLLWFVREADEDKPVLSMAEMHDLVASYLARLDPQIEEEKKQRRAGRPMSKAQQELEATKALEARQYEKEGLIIPDLTGAESASSARYWDETLQGNAGYYSRLRLVRIYKDEQELAVEQVGESLGTKPKDGAGAKSVPSTEEENGAMQE